MRHVGVLGVVAVAIGILAGTEQAHALKAGDIKSPACAHFAKSFPANVSDLTLLVGNPQVQKEREGACIQNSTDPSKFICRYRHKSNGKKFRCRIEVRRSSLNGVELVGAQVEDEDGEASSNWPTGCAYFQKSIPKNAAELFQLTNIAASKKAHRGACTVNKNDGTQSICVFVHKAGGQKFKCKAQMKRGLGDRVDVVKMSSDIPAAEVAAVEQAIEKQVFEKKEDTAVAEKVNDAVVEKAEQASNAAPVELKAAHFNTVKQLLAMPKYAADRAHFRKLDEGCAQFKLSDLPHGAELVQQVGADTAYKSRCVKK